MISLFYTNYNQYIYSLILKAARQDVKNQSFHHHGNCMQQSTILGSI